MLPVELDRGGATRECPGGGAGSGGRHIAKLSEFGQFSDGKLKKNCMACCERERIRKQPALQQGVVARAEAARAAADASPVVLDDERSSHERHIICAEILNLANFRSLSASATVLIFASTRVRIGETSWATAEELLFREATSTWSRRGGAQPSLLHADGSVITGTELRRAGAVLELLYASDRVHDATGNVESGKGAIEGRLIRAIEEAHGCTAVVRETRGYRACVESHGALVNKSATARGCAPAAGMWGMACALILPQGWQSVSQWCLMDGATVHQTAVQGQAARGSGGSYLLPPLGPKPMPAVSPNGDAWRQPGETSADMLARTVNNRREWARLKARFAAADDSGSGSSSLSAAVTRPSPRVAGQQQLSFAHRPAAGSAVVTPTPANLAGRAEDDDDGRADDDDDRGGGDGAGMLSGMPPPFAGYPGFDLYMGGSGGGGSGGGGSGSGGGGNGGGSGRGGTLRPICRYGAACYQKSPWHKAQFEHPAAPDATAALARSTTPPPRGAISDPPRSASPVQGREKKARYL